MLSVIRRCIGCVFHEGIGIAVTADVAYNNGNFKDNLWSGILVGSSGQSCRCGN